MAYCLVASITETGLGDASPYLLNLVVAASLLAAPVRRGATMKILIVHNRYRPTAPSGENVVVDQESSALSSRGHEVALFQRHSEEIAALVAAAACHPAGPRAVERGFAARDRRVLIEFAPMSSTSTTPFLW